jgi:hypothetical protein
LRAPGFFNEEKEAPRTNVLMVYLLEEETQLNLIQLRDQLKLLSLLINPGFRQDEHHSLPIPLPPLSDCFAGLAHAKPAISTTSSAGIPANPTSNRPTTRNKKRELLARVLSNPLSPTEQKNSYSNQMTSITISSIFDHFK